MTNVLTNPDPDKRIKREMVISPKSDAVTIFMLKGSKLQKIMNRKQGEEYVVDSSLAHHYVYVLKVAKVLKGKLQEKGKRK